MTIEADTTPEGLARRVAQAEAGALKALDACIAAHDRITALSVDVTAMAERLAALEHQIASVGTVADHLVKQLADIGEQMRALARPHLH
jgi:hypothetical protein